MANINSPFDAKFRFMLPQQVRVSEGYVIDPPGSINPVNRTDGRVYEATRKNQCGDRLYTSPDVDCIVSRKEY